MKELKFEHDEALSVLEKQLIFVVLFSVTWSMKNKKAAFILICLFFVYVVLTLFNTLYWTSSYDDNILVKSIGGLTDGEMLEVMWIPGQFPGFVFSTIADADLTIPAAVFTFLAGAFIIIKVFKLSFSDLNIRSHKEGK